MTSTTLYPTPRRGSPAQQEADCTAESCPLPTHSPTGLAILRATLVAETARRRQLEREILGIRSTLEQARAELAGTQAGERRAHHAALHDELTALPNRRFFQQRLALALARVSPEHPTLAVLYLDIDDFKPVNDRYGHDTGDELLRIIAARLARAVREEDTMSRLGGDEFACLPGDFVDPDQLGQLAAKLIETVSAPFRLGRLTLTVRPSIGIATYPADGQTADALIRSADAAMFRAKRQQCGYAFSDPRSRERVSRLNTASTAAPVAAAISTALTGSALI